EHMAGALCLDKPRILIGEKMRKMLGNHRLHEPISEEFKAVLAHEISHLKHGDVKLWKVIPLRLSPFLGLAAGFAGVAYAEHLKKKEHETSKQKDAATARADIHAEWEKSDQPSEPFPEAMNPLLRIGKYVAGGLLGFAVGTGLYALAHRHIEFRADRVSAELIEDGKPLARALQSLREQLQNSVRQNPEIIGEIKKMNPVKKMLHALMHPSDAERIRRLESWAR
ncbi:MAG: M48 family metallopeptidase, partial [Alphaproteobacteria bacterium]